MVPAPLITTLNPSPGWPEVEVICTPAACPWRDCKAFVVLSFCKSSPFSCTLAPVLSAFFCSPYPITTTSESVVRSPTNVMSKLVWLPTRISFVVYPINEITRTSSGAALSTNFPFASVEAPIVVPFSKMFTPGIRAPDSSLTVPDTCCCCACAMTHAHNTNAVTPKSL